VSGLNDLHKAMGPSIIPCASCSRDLSADAETCPACGGPNYWMHPRIAAVITHLNGLDRVTKYEARGHRVVLQCTHQTPRQVLGSLLMFLGMGCFVLGFFMPPFVMIGLFCVCLGGLLTLFGLSVTTPHELSIDLRVPGGLVGTCDRTFWQDVLAIIEINPAPTGPITKPPGEPPLWA
jgi:hypothetical protein